MQAHIQAHAWWQSDGAPETMLNDFSMSTRMKTRNENRNETTREHRREREREGRRSSKGGQKWGVGSVERLKCNCNK